MNEQLRNLQNFFNSDQFFDKPNNLKVSEILSSFCSKKLQLKITCTGRSICMFCFLRISQKEKHLTFKNCACLQTSHFSCLEKELILKINNNLNNISSICLNCTRCNKPNTIDQIKNVFGPFEFDLLVSDINKKRLIQDENEKLDKEIAIKLQKQLQGELEDEATFDCPMCFETRNINKHCLTLKCDHQFCSECLKEYIKAKMVELKCSEKDLVCPTCNHEIIRPIIESILNEDEIKNLDKIVNGNLNPNILVQDEVFVKCPKAECINFVVLPLKSKITHHICEVCKTDFCVRGCPKPHRPRTCEEHLIFLEEERKKEEERRMEEIKKIQEEAKKQEELRKFNLWKTENEQTEERFRALVQQENLKMCPSCKGWVQRISGCNYILCRCMYEFCYVCSSHYPKHVSKCGH